MRGIIIRGRRGAKPVTAVGGALALSLTFTLFSLSLGGGLFFLPTFRALVLLSRVYSIHSRAGGLLSLRASFYPTVLLWAVPPKKTNLS